MSETKKESFPIARRLIRFGKRWRANWLLRHQNPISYWLHLIGIPMTLFGLICLFCLPAYIGLGAFLLGYFLQFIGHAIEGNDVGEMIPFKRRLGLPTLAISPRYLRQKEISSSST